MYPESFEGFLTTEAWFDRTCLPSVLSSLHAMRPPLPAAVDR